MTSQAITQDLSSPLGSNSWYLCRPLSACNSLFDGQELGYYVHAYQCKCGDTKIMINNSSKHKNHSCQQCLNKQFLGEHTYSNFYGELLAKIDMPVKYTISGTYAHATLYFAKPIGIDFK